MTARSAAQPGPARRGWGFAMTGVLLLVSVSCQQLIDLGDAPEVVRVKTGDNASEKADASPHADAAAKMDASDVDGSTPSAKPNAPPTELACGIPPPAGPECGDCVTAKCCDESFACGEDPKCVEGIACLRLCAEAGCVSRCLGEFANDALNAFFTCNLTQCVALCSPGPNCLRLAEECCANTSALAVQEGCIRTAQGEDEQACEAAMNGVYKAICAPAE